MALENKLGITDSAELAREELLRHYRRFISVCLKNCMILQEKYVR